MVAVRYAMTLMTILDGYSGERRKRGGAGIRCTPKKNISTPLLFNGSVGDEIHLRAHLRGSHRVGGRRWKVDQRGRSHDKVG